MNVCKAGERAGCSQRTAFRFMDNPDVRQHIDELMDELMAEIKSEKIADATEVMEYLTAVMRGETKEELVMPGGLEPEIVEVAPNTRNRLRAAELLGKRHRLFTAKVEVAATVPVVICGAEELDD